MTKQQFLDTYRAEIIARYSWAADTAKLERFMDSVRATIATQEGFAHWNHQGDAVDAAWKAIGGKEKHPTLKALRALA